METRIEKYRKYREEIQAMSGDEVTTKVKTSQRAQQFLDEKDKKKLSEMNSSTISISYKEIMDAYDIYEKEHPEEKNMLELQEKRRKVFLIVGVSLIIALLIALVIVGIIVFGGNK